MASKTMVSMVNSGERQVALAALAVLSVFLLGFIAWCAYHVLAGDVNWTAAARVANREFAFQALEKVLFNPWFYGGALVILTLELLIPADRHQPLFSISMRHDMAYFVLFVLASSTVRPLYAAFLAVVADTALGQHVRPLGVVWPAPVAILLGYLAVDFLGWMRHLVIHKVRPFWFIHSIHHSQRHLNLFSSTRLFPAGGLIGQTITFLPAYILTGSLDVSLGYLIFHQFVDRLNHANVRTDLGWLRYVLVTPQSHRIHHSCEPRHYDTNFGVSLCIWDRLFGTHCDENIYPPTGIPDPEFPNETAGQSTLGVLWLQFTYPFWKTVAYLRDESATPRPAVGARATDLT